MKIVQCGGEQTLWPDYTPENLDEAVLDDETDQSAPSPDEFRDGMQLIYAALLAGTVLVSKDSNELKAFLNRNGVETVCAIGEEIATARMWCEQVAASLRLLEARTLTAAMSLGSRA